MGPKKVIKIESSILTSFFAILACDIGQIERPPILVSIGGTLYIPDRYDKISAFSFFENCENQ